MSPSCIRVFQKVQNANLAVFCANLKMDGVTWKVIEKFRFFGIMIIIVGYNLHLHCASIRCALRLGHLNRVHQLVVRYDHLLNMSAYICAYICKFSYERINNHLYECSFMLISMLLLNQGWAITGFYPVDTETKTNPENTRPIDTTRD